MQNNKQFDILAKHFSKELGLIVEFKGNDAKVDLKNKRITLPENLDVKYIRPLLSALIHEAYHSRCHSKAPAYYEYGPYKPLKEKEILYGVFEDIRIDSLSRADYSGCKGLQRSLFEYFKPKKGEAVDGLNFKLKFLRDMIIRAYKDDSFNDYLTGDEQAEKLFKDNEKLVNDILMRLDGNTDPESVYECVEDMFKVLYKDKFEKADSSGLVDPKGKPMPPDKVNEHNQNALKVGNKIDEMIKTLEEANQKAGANPPNSEMQKKIDKLVNRDNSAISSYNNRRNDEFNKDNKDQSVESMLDAMGHGIGGMEDLNAPENHLLNIVFNAKEKFIQFLQNFKTTNKIHEQGKINPHALNNYFDVEHLFKKSIIKDKSKTELIFVLDNSGSMEGENQKTVFNAIDKMAEAIQEAEYDGVLTDNNFDYSIFTFNNEYRTIKDFGVRYDKKRFKDDYRVSGGTKIEPIMNHLIKKYKDKKDNNSKRVVCIMTDGDFYCTQEELSKLLEDFKDGGKTDYILIGIGHTNGNALFSNYNVENLSQFDEVLLKALEGLM